uniref:E3 ubiquitin ligase UBR4 C-terminal domain-containing protein n=1 Tax=Timema monikensis TaxID=170555 RepID=A0A7R9HMX5_9NEOP|nr:unnamed protein product [Timema monikensis]
MSQCAPIFAPYPMSTGYLRPSRRGSSVPTVIYRVSLTDVSLLLARARDEWESAALQNANTKCNGLLPLWGPQVPESAFASCLARHNTYLQECTGHRFATEKSFHDDTGGGGPQSNMHMIPYLIHMALYVINTPSKTRSGPREDKNLTSYLDSPGTDKWVESCYDAEGPLYWSVLSLLLHPPSHWARARLTHLRRLVVLAHARHCQPAGPTQKLLDISPRDYSVYKSYLVFFGLVDAIYANCLKKVSVASDDQWPSTLADYIRHNDEALLKASERLLATYREELLPCTSFEEFCDVTEAKLPKTKPVETLKRAACDPFLKCKLAFCKTIADECQPFLQRFQTSKPMTPYLFEAVEKLLRYLMNRCVKPDLMKCTGPKLLSIDTKKSENLILSKNIDIGFATKRLLGETAITVTERQKLEFIHECRSMLTTMIAKLQEKSPLKQKAVRGLSSLDPCVIQHSPQLAQKRFSFLLEELNHANIINDVLAENAKKEYLHFCNLKKSELQEIFRPCDQFSDEVGLDTIYGSFLIGEANYKHLWEVIKICLVLSHGNATVEGGFSVNKSLLVENMHEKTVIAQRHIHDEIQEAGGIKNIHISKKMLDYVRGARKRYHEYLEMKKQEKSEKDKKKAEKRKLDIQVKDLEGERKKLMMATEEKREAIDVELQELKKKQASLY